MMDLSLSYEVAFFPFRSSGRREIPGQHDDSGAVSAPVHNAKPRRCVASRCRCPETLVGDTEIIAVGAPCEILYQGRRAAGM